MGKEDILDQFEEELFYYLDSDKYEVETIYYNSMHMNPARHDLCKIYSPEKRRSYSHVGTFAGVDIYDTLRTDRDNAYKIDCQQIYHECDKCSAHEMFDEANSVYYCPRCDDRKTRFKDKVFNLLG